MAADLAVIAFEGAHLASVGMFLDAFALVRRRVAAMFETRDPVGMATRIRLLTPGGGSIRFSGGRALSADGGIDSDATHLLVHVPDFEMDDDSFPARFDAMRGLIEWLGRQHAAGSLLSATGQGVFLLAEAGVLGEGPVAVPPATAALFRRRYPRVRIDARSTVVDRESIVTTGGMATELRMIAHLIERLMSPQMAGSLAAAMALDRLEEDGLSDDPLVSAAQIWLAEHFAGGARIGALAEQLAVSQQTLIRRFRVKLGMTPRDYVQMLRIRSAQTQLRRTNRPIAQIATLVGYDDLKSFREAFRARTGMSASSYRASGGEPAKD